MEYKVEIALTVGKTLVECVRIHVEGYLIEFASVYFLNIHKLRNKRLIRFLKGKYYIFEKDIGQQCIYGAVMTRTRKILFSDILELGLDRSHLNLLYKAKFKSKPKRELNVLKLMSKFYGRK